jgi:hypothetical protein
MKIMQPKFDRTLMWLLTVSLLLPLRVFAAGDDNFNDNSKDTSKWGNDVVTGGFGILTEQNQRLEFTVNNPLTDGDTLRPWILERFPVDADWTIQLDTVNSTVPSVFGQVNSGGFTLFHPSNADSEIYLELYAVPFGKGMVADISNDGLEVNNTDINVGGNEAVMAAVRMEYQSALKVVTCSYDTNIVDGYQWEFLASYGLDGAGGSTANTSWGLSSNQQFSVWVYGFAESMTVSSGQLYLDNFVETGGVPSSGGPAPVPTGNFGFSFPTNNPLLVAIANISGNYVGTCQIGSMRSYTLDVAQDESGKIMAMGSVDGITNSEGGSDIAGSAGAIKTVDDQPTLALKGSFAGSMDSQPVTLKTTVTSPVELSDIGGGTNGLTGTASISGQALGVPFSRQSEPVAVPATPSMEANLRKDWSLQLDISQKTINGKNVTVASAVLTLPNGDTIVYPERTAKYSTTSGFKLSFKGGTNTTAMPNRVDKKSKITITGLTFMQQGDEWLPTGGTISYQFLGQKGAASLLDFLTE